MYTGFLRGKQQTCYITYVWVINFNEKYRSNLKNKITKTNSEYLF